MSDPSKKASPTTNGKQPSPNTDRPIRHVPGETDSEASFVAQIVAKLGAELPGIPYVGPLTNALVDLLQQRKERARDAMLRENDTRLSNFFSEMLGADSTMDEQVANAMMDSRDFHALLRACVADIEEEKVGTYATLARKIAAGSVSKEWRRHFILSLKEFSNAELDLMRRAHVAKRHKMLATPGTAQSLSESDVLHIGKPSSHHAILMNNLAIRGFAHDGKLSEIGELFTTACWREDQLTPTALGYRTWTGHNVPILNYEIGEGTLDDLASSLQVALLHDGVQSNIVAVIDSNSAKIHRMNSSMAVLLVGRASKHLTNALPHLVELANKVPMLRVDADHVGIPLHGLSPFETVVCAGRPHKEIITEIQQKLAAQSYRLG